MNSFVFEIVLYIVRIWGLPHKQGPLVFLSVCLASLHCQSVVRTGIGYLFQFSNTQIMLLVAIRFLSSHMLLKLYGMVIRELVDSDEMGMNLVPSNVK